MDWLTGVGGCAPRMKDFNPAVDWADVPAFLTWDGTMPMFFVMLPTFPPSWAPVTLPSTFLNFRSDLGRWEFVLGNAPFIFYRALGPLGNDAPGIYNRVLGIVGAVSFEIEAYMP